MGNSIKCGHAPAKQIQIEVAEKHGVPLEIMSKPVNVADVAWRQAQAEAIKRIRDELNYSWLRLARLFGMSTTTLYNRYHGGK